MRLVWMALFGFLVVWARPSQAQWAPPGDPRLDRCAELPACAEEGLCHSFGGQCVALYSTDCFKPCYEDQRCAVYNGRCVRPVELPGRPTERYSLPLLATGSAFIGLGAVNILLCLPWGLVPFFCTAGDQAGEGFVLWLTTNSIMVNAGLVITPIGARRVPAEPGDVELGVGPGGGSMTVRF